MSLRLGQSSTALDPKQPPQPLGRNLEKVAFATASAHSRTLVRLRLLWDSRRLLLLATAWALVTSTLVAFVIPVRYESRARIAPPDSGSASAMSSAAAMLGSLAGKMGGLTSLAESTLGVKSSGAFFVAILQSETVEDDLIRKFELQKLYRARYLEDARKELSRRTSVVEDRESGVIAIVVTDHDRARAAAMTQEYINQLDVVVSKVSTSSARRERTFLEGRLSQVRQELENAEQQFSQFASQKKAVNLEAQSKAMLEAGAGLQGQLIAAESQLEGFRQIYADQNIRVRSMQARVNELRQALEKIAGKGVTENSSADQLYPSLRQLPLLGVDYADLFRRVKVEEAVFEILTQEFELAKVQEARDIPTVKVLDSPLVPQKKSFPPRFAIILGSTVFAFCLGAGWVLARSAWESVDSTDPRKVFLTDIVMDVRLTLRNLSKKGRVRDIVKPGSGFVKPGVSTSRDAKSAEDDF